MSGIQIGVKYTLESINGQAGLNRIVLNEEFENSFLSPDELKETIKQKMGEQMFRDGYDPDMRNIRIAPVYKPDRRDAELDAISARKVALIGGRITIKEKQ